MKKDAAEEAGKHADAAASDSLLLDGAGAAALLGFSLRHFERHVAPSLPIVRCGRLVRFARVDLEGWIDAKRFESCAPATPPRSWPARGKQKPPELVIDPRRRLRPRESGVERPEIPPYLRLRQPLGEPKAPPQPLVIPPERRLRPRKPAGPKL